MSYKLGQMPSPQATLAEVADFMEYQCLISDDNSYSAISGKAAMGIFCDEDDLDSVEDIFPEFDNALSEIEDRYTFSKTNYPFEASTNTIKVRAGIDSRIMDIYTFLLLATRENMSEGKISDGTDGTALFEKLCAAVLNNYFGEHCTSFVFGTGQDEKDTFQNKVQSFLDKLGEGKMVFRSPEYNKNKQKDGKLDIVAFIPFADSRTGRFIAFGQCKTGTNWRTSISQMNPKAFCELYCSPMPGFTPIAIFMVAEAFTDAWEERQRSSNGILFDRARIMNYLPEKIDTTLLEQIRKWNSAVLKKHISD